MPRNSRSSLLAPAWTGVKPSMFSDRWFGATLFTAVAASAGCEPDVMKFHGKAGAAGAEAEAGSGGTGSTEPSEAGSPSTGGVSCPSAGCSGGTTATGGNASGGVVPASGGEAGDGDGSSGQAGSAGSSTEPPGWMGNAEDCPVEPPTAHTACTVAEGQVCAYNEPGELYQECACHAFCDDEGPVVQWNCYATQVNAADCPVEEPTQGSDCFGLKGLRCRYPVARQCHCPPDAGDDAWNCTEITRGPPVFPTAIDPQTIVSMLTDADREAWCKWFAETEIEPGFPQSPVLEPDPDGYYPDTGCYQSSSTCPVDMPTFLPKEPCIANLELSSCEATVEELNHCVLSMKTQDHPHARGCARFLEAPNCLGTLVSPYDATTPFQDCRIRVVE